jgi:hypothetical protein
LPNIQTSDRRLSALRALADRPGTEAEGRLAREILERLEVRDTEEYRRWQRKEISLDDLLRSVKPEPLTREELAFLRYRTDQEREAKEAAQHIEIQKEIRKRFTKGDRVYYNQWAYDANDPGTVTGYLRPKKENGTHPWAWINVKLDRLLWPRQLPIWSERGWHLTHEPVSAEEAERLSKP